MVKAYISDDHAKGNADYIICMLARFTAKKSHTAVVAEDLDVFQLMLDHAKATDNSENMYITAQQTMCITTLSLSESILFLHALSGCDTTSRPYGIGKVTVLTKYTTLNTSGTVFISPSSSQQDIQQAREDAMLEIYNNNNNNNCLKSNIQKVQWTIINDIHI